MNGDERTYLNGRLTALETVVKERWDAHDKASSERWEHTQDSLAAIHERMMCEAHTEGMKNLGSSQAKLWFAFVTVVLVGIVLGIWIRGIVHV